MLLPDGTEPIQIRVIDPGESLMGVTGQVLRIDVNIPIKPNELYPSPGPGEFNYKYTISRSLRGKPGLP